MWEWPKIFCYIEIKKFTKKIFSKNRGWKNIFLLYTKVCYAIHKILKTKKRPRESNCQTILIISAALIFWIIKRLLKFIVFWMLRIVRQFRIIQIYQRMKKVLDFPIYLWYHIRAYTCIKRKKNNLKKFIKSIDLL